MSHTDGSLTTMVDAEKRVPTANTTNSSDDNSHHSSKEETVLDNKTVLEESKNVISERNEQPGDIEANASSSEEEPEERSITGFKWFLSYTSIILTVLLYSLDGTIVADIQPPIVETLGGADKLPWIGIAAALGTTQILTVGKGFGVFNNKWLFNACVVVFEVGSVLCGAAPNMDAFIVGRLLQGLGGCGCYTGAITFISRLTTTRERPLYLAGILVIWGIGSVIGPVVGGAFAESSATWRWAFYINLFIAAITAPGLLWCLPSIDPTGITFTEKLKKMDWIGIAIFGAGCTCFTMALAFGGVVYPFDSPEEIVLWVMSGVLLIATCLLTKFHPGVKKEDRLYPIHLFKYREINLLKIAMFGAMGALMVSLYYIPLLFQFTRGDGPLDAGVRLLPFIFSLIAAELLNGWLMPKYGYYMPWYIAGTAIMLGGGIGMVTLDSHTTDSQIYAFTALVGAGVGFYFSAGFAVAQVVVPVSELSNSVGYIAIGQMIGQVTILSLAGSLYQNISIREIGKLLPDAVFEEVYQLTTGRHSIAFESLSKELQDEVTSIITVSLRNAFSLIVPAAGMALIASLFLSRRKIY